MKAARNLLWSGIVESVKSKKNYSLFAFSHRTRRKNCPLDKHAPNKSLSDNTSGFSDQHLFGGFNSRFQRGGWYWPCVLTQSQGTVTSVSLPELRLPFVLTYNTVFLCKLSYYPYFSGHMFFVALFAWMNSATIQHQLQEYVTRGAKRNLGKFSQV